MLLRAAIPEPICLNAMRLSAGVALMLLPDGEEHLDALASLRRAPYGTVSVRHDGRERHLAALDLAGHDGRVISLRDVELVQLTGPLDPHSRRRLLRFLLGFCRSAFRLGQAPAFSATCRRLIEDVVPRAGTAVPVARLLGSLVLLRDAAVPAGHVLHLVGEHDTFAASLRGSGQAADPVWGGLQAIEQPAEDCLMFADGEHPRHWIVQAADSPLPDVMQLLETAGPGRAALRGACLRALAPLARQGNRASALLHDIQLSAPLPMQIRDEPDRAVGGALELAISDRNGGLFLRGWLRDPLDQVEAVSVLTVAGSIDVTNASLHRLPRPDLAQRLSSNVHRGGGFCPGFVAHVSDPSLGHTRQPQLLVQMRSGSRLVLTPRAGTLPPAASRDAVLGSAGLAHLTPALFETCIRPATRALHAAASANRSTPDVVRIGTPLASPAISILVPVYRTLGFLRFQFAALARDPDMVRSELILALDSPEQRAELEHLLRGLHLLHALPVTLVVMADNAGFAAATNAAAAQARAPLLLLLNSDVVPERPGWLTVLSRALADPRIGAVGPRLLFDDDSIQHAGLFFERDQDGTWFNRHYHKGMPRDWFAASRPRLVPGVTGGAVMLRADDFATVGGVDEDYVIGDYEDSDLCLMLRRAGLAIAYVPAATLYHFERRSIRLHGGYSRTLASTYNRRLHHERWDAAIEDAMREARMRLARRP